MVMQMLQEMRRDNSQSYVTGTKNGTRKYRFLPG